MVLIKSNKLIGLLVATESGERLGTVRSFDVDVDSHTIVRYHVKPGSIVAMIGQGEFLIHASQVVQITEKKMTVRDNTVVASSSVAVVGA